MKQLTMFLLIVILLMTACTQNSTTTPVADNQSQQIDATDENHTETGENPEHQQNLPYWADDLQSGDWYYIKTIPTLNIEISGSDFQDIAPNGRNVINFTDDMRFAVISKDFDSGEIIRDDEYEYYFGDYLEMVYIFFPNYEFEGEVYEIHFRYTLYEGYLYEMAYLESSNEEVYLVSNCNMYSQDKDALGPGVEEKIKNEQTLTGTQNTDSGLSESKPTKTSTETTPSAKIRGCEKTYKDVIGPVITNVSEAVSESVEIKYYPKGDVTYPFNGKQETCYKVRIKVKWLYETEEDIYYVMIRDYYLLNYNGKCIVVTFKNIDSWYETFDGTLYTGRG